MYVYIYIVNSRIKWYMHATFHVSRCKSLSFAGKDIFYIPVMAEILLGLCKEGWGGVCFLVCI